LAGTTNFGKILSSVADASAEDHDRAVLAYSVYFDRLMSYISQYLFKLLSTVPLEEIDGLVFSGGIGEKGAQLRKDVLDKFKWLSAEVDAKANEANQGEVREITTGQSKLKGWVVETDEEKQCVELARKQLSF
jgi:acetate kinase